MNIYMGSFSLLRTNVAQKKIFINFGVKYDVFTACDELLKSNTDNQKKRSEYMIYM